jgi:hypothetical protein
LDIKTERTKTVELLDPACTTCGAIWAALRICRQATPSSNAAERHRAGFHAHYGNLLTKSRFADWLTNIPRPGSSYCPCRALLPAAGVSDACPHGALVGNFWRQGHFPGEAPCPARGLRSMFRFLRKSMHGQAKVQRLTGNRDRR